MFNVVDVNEVLPAEEPGRFPLLSALRILWQRRRQIFLVWIAGTLLVFALVRAMPSVYRAEAVVLVDSQKIPEIFVSPTVSGDVADRLALLTQTIMTSERLLDIIQHFDLYRKERGQLTQEELLHRMRDDISVTIEKSWTGGRMQAFRLAYQGSDPKVVTRVTNRLASLYVEENMRARENQAEGTVEFLRRQLGEAKTSLDEQEAKVAKFKQQRNGSLPEQQTSLLGTLNSLSVQVEGVNASIVRAHENKMALEGSLSAAESSEASLRASLRRLGADGGQTGNGLSAPRALRSEALAEQLRALKLRYAADYPTVQILEAQVAEAREREQAEDAAADQLDKRSEGKTHPVVTSPELLVQGERIANLRAQVKVADHQLQALEKERQQLAASIAQTQAQIGRLPLVEQEMAALKRNYDESASNYKSLLQKQLAAGMATDMERSQKSERFNISDAARVPEQPVRPKRALLVALGSFASLLVASLIAFALGFRKQVFLGEWELPPGTVVLGRVPNICMALDAGAEG